MQKARKWMQAALVFTGFLAFIIWNTKQRAKMDENIELHGIRLHAVVTRVHYARGRIMNLTFRYEGNYHTSRSQTSDFDPQPGDSVSILFLPSQTDKKILVENRFFAVPRKSYFGWIDGH
jgi:hypothetical protein